MTAKDKIFELQKFYYTLNEDMHTVARLLGVTYQALKYWLDGKREIPEPAAKLIKLLNNHPHLVNEVW